MESVPVPGYKHLVKTPGVCGGRTTVRGGRMRPCWVVLYADDEPEMFDPGEPYNYISSEAIEECRRYLREFPEDGFDSDT